jgi:hypothetical protein
VTKSRRVPPPPDSRCHYCGDTSTGWDHVIPRSRGGRHALWNRVLACDDCNQAKGDLFPACPCDFCIAAIEQHDSIFMIGGVYPLGPPELETGLPVESLDQLRAWTQRNHLDTV